MHAPDESVRGANDGGTATNQIQPTTDFLLTVARNVIELRAARDGYEPYSYDAERCPAVYVTSLLDALHP